MKSQDKRPLPAEGLARISPVSQHRPPALRSLALAWQRLLQFGSGWHRNYETSRKSVRLGASTPLDGWRQARLGVLVFGEFMVPIEKNSLKKFAEQLRGTLEKIESRGVKWKNTRFGRYLDVIDKFSQYEFPRPFPFAEPNELALFSEAACQAQQLIDSEGAWPNTPPEVLRQKLALVVQGPDITPPDHSDDKGRNALVELTTAAMLARRNFTVCLTGQEEDISATFPGLPRFVVECKRPTHQGRLKKHVKALRHQLESRRKPGEYGIAVIAADRLLGMSELGGSVDAEADVERLVMGGVHKVIKAIKEAEVEARTTLAPHASMAAILLVGAIFLREPGYLVTISQIGLYFPAGDQHETSQRIHQALSSVIDTAVD